MRSEVHPGDLPAEDDESSFTNDVSSYQAIGTAAARTYDMCAKGLKSPGWATVGNATLHPSCVSRPSKNTPLAQVFFLGEDECAVGLTGSVMRI